MRSIYAEKEYKKLHLEQIEWEEMGEFVKNTTIESSRHVVSRPELKERIVNVATAQFTERGIRCVTMDGIAALLGISKRTLYEVFPDKESLLEQCILHTTNEAEQFVSEVRKSAENVLEVILKCYQYSIQRFHATNKSFFEDIKKYPKAYELLRHGRSRDSEETIRFFISGVEQGIFRNDINFAIMNQLVRGQLDMLQNTDICKEYSFVEVYESIMFTYLRGISTERGAQVLEDFIREYRGKECR